LSGVDIVT
jgi:hypothetical protein